MNPPERRAPDVAAVEVANLKGEMHTGFAEVGGKLDTLIAKFEAAESARVLDRETADARHDDHEKRLRAVEIRKTVAPWQLWMVVSGGVLTASAVIAIWRGLTG